MKLLIGKMLPFTKCQNPLQYVIKKSRPKVKKLWLKLKTTVIRHRLYKVIFDPDLNSAPKLD